MNCIVVDDEQTSRNIIIKLCERVKNINVKNEFENALDALKFLDNNDVDFIFLDIHMPQLSGFDFIEHLNKTPKIILTTIDRDLAIKAFEYNSVVDYLGKPFNFPRFVIALEKVKRAIQISAKNQKKLKDNCTKDDLTNEDDLYIHVKNKLIKISIKDIEIIKTHANGVQIVMEDCNYIIKTSLVKILKKLPKAQFIKVHQSYIINLSKIVDIQSTHILINKEEIPISKLNKASLMSRINLM